MTSSVLALVGCGDKKKSTPTEARRLYVSDYFRKKREWAEGCDRWRILSAEHGLVHPTSILEPYDTVLSELDEEETEQWAADVTQNLRPMASDFDEIVFLAGEDYVNPIVEQGLPANVNIRWPFEGRRIGEQIQWLQNNPAPDQSTFESLE